MLYETHKKASVEIRLDYANVNVKRHSIVKGTLVLTTKAVKSPSAALNLLNITGVYLLWWRWLSDDQQIKCS